MCAWGRTLALGSLGLLTLPFSGGCAPRETEWLLEWECEAHEAQVDSLVATLWPAGCEDTENKTFLLRWSVWEGAGWEPAELEDQLLGFEVEAYAGSVRLARGCTTSRVASTVTTTLSSEAVCHGPKQP